MRLPSRRRTLAGAIAAAAAALMLTTDVFVEIHLERFKLVQAPIQSSGGAARVSASPQQLERLGAPFAVIGRIHNASGSAPFAVSIDGTTVCNPTIREGASRRFDCAVPRSPVARGGEHSVTIAGPATPWSLDYLELATHHGSTSGERDIVILPRAFDRYRQLALPWVACLAALVFAAVAFMRQPPAWPRWLWIAYEAIAGLLLALFAAIQVSSWVSSYRIAISLESLSFWLVLLLMPSLWSAVRWLFSATETTDARWSSAIRAAFIGLLVLALYGALTRERLHDTYKGNYSGFLSVSERNFSDNPLLGSRDDIRRTLVLQPSGGYDGQFMYFAAFDPLLQRLRGTPEQYRAMMDAPPYRFGRIGYPLLTLLFSGGQWQRFPATMIWLILASLALSAFAIAQMAQARGLNAATGLVVAAVPGFWQSLQYGLPEPIAAAALLAGLWCLWSARWLAAGALFALSLLVRETGIVAIGGLVLAEAASRRRREPLLAGIAAAAALLAWRLYVMWALYADWGLRGLLFHPEDLGWPFAGFVDLWNAIASGRYYATVSDLSRAGIAYPVLLILGLALAAALTIAKPAAAPVLAVFYGLLAVSLNYDAIWIHIGNGQRGTYELFLMLAICTLTMRAYSKRLQAGMLAFWCAAAAYVLFFGIDAAYIRSALALPF